MVQVNYEDSGHYKNNHIGIFSAMPSLDIPHKHQRKFLLFKYRHTCILTFEPSLI